MKLLTAFAFSAVVASAVPVPITATTGSAFSVDFDGFTGSSQTPIDGLTSTLSFSGFTFASQWWGATRVDFRLDIQNTSSGPITASRVSVVGFNTEETVLPWLPTVTGVYDNVTEYGNMPGGIGRTDFCLSSGNCAGGGGGGVTQGDTGTAYATIYLAGSGRTSLTFDEMFVRYQSISGAGRMTSAVGAALDSPVPEPGAYLILMLGLALVVWKGSRISSRVAAD